MRSLLRIHIDFHGREGRSLSGSAITLKDNEENERMREIREGGSKGRADVFVYRYVVSVPAFLSRPGARSGSPEPGAGPRRS